MRRAASFAIMAFAVLFLLLAQGMPRIAHGASITASTVAISPVGICCGGPSSPYKVGDEFSVNVTANIPYGETINTFDVRINYSNPYSASPPRGVLHATSILAGTLFSGMNPQPLIECIDGVDLISYGGGCPNDNIGQVHLSAGILGSGIDGPVSGTLFTMTFSVTGVGSSIFSIDTANLADPNPDSSNPEPFNAHYIPVVEQDGIFANQGVTAFFNYAPVNTQVAAAILPNEQVAFDASGSFDANNSTMSFWRYSWNFGDNSPRQNSTTAIVEHPFRVPGNYTVSLTVFDDQNVTGSIARIVPVFPALGGVAIIVKNQNGEVMGNVVVKIYNSSSSPSPIENVTTLTNLGLAQFGKLTPGSYFVVFSVQGYLAQNKTEPVLPAWTTQDTVYLSPKPVPPNPPDYSGLIYVGTIGGGIAIVAAALVWQRAKSSRRRVKSAGKSLASSRG
jgi:PKD repeat protein